MDRYIEDKTYRAGYDDCCALAAFSSDMPIAWQEGYLDAERDLGNMDFDPNQRPVTA